MSICNKREEKYAKYEFLSNGTIKRLWKTDQHVLVIEWKNKGWKKYDVFGQAVECSVYVLKNHKKTNRKAGSQSTLLFLEKLYKTEKSGKQFGIIRYLADQFPVVLRTVTAGGVFKDRLTKGRRLGQPYIVTDRLAEPVTVDLFNLV